jgi:hypothetical protein
MDSSPALDSSRPRNGTIALADVGGGNNESLPSGVSTVVHQVDSPVNPDGKYTASSVAADSSASASSDSSPSQSVMASASSSATVASSAVTSSSFSSSAASSSSAVAASSTPSSDLDLDLLTLVADSLPHPHGLTTADVAARPYIFYSYLAWHCEEKSKPERKELIGLMQEVGAERDFKTVTKLDFSRSCFNAADIKVALQTLPDLSHVEILDFSHCPVGDAIVPVIKDPALRTLENVRVLILDQTGLTSTGFSQLLPALTTRKFRNLQTLSVSGEHKLSASVDKMLEYVPASSLTRICMDGTDLKEPDAEKLMHLQVGLKLAGRECKITGPNITEKRLVAIERKDAVKIIVGQTETIARQSRQIAEQQQLLNATEVTDIEHIERFKRYDAKIQQSEEINKSLKEENVSLEAENRVLSKDKESLQTTLTKTEDEKRHLDEENKKLVVEAQQRDETHAAELKIQEETKQRMLAALQEQHVAEIKALNEAHAANLQAGEEAQQKLIQEKEQLVQRIEAERNSKVAAEQEVARNKETIKYLEQYRQKALAWWDTEFPRCQQAMTILPQKEQQVRELEEANKKLKEEIEKITRECEAKLKQQKKDTVTQLLSSIGLIAQFDHTLQAQSASSQSQSEESKSLLPSSSSSISATPSVGGVAQ